MRVFLSHNKADKEVARALGASLVLAGADVWFDEWEIRAGDSIPAELNEGLCSGFVDFGSKLHYTFCFLTDKSKVSSLM